MTLRKLSKYYELRKKLVLYERTLESLRSAAETTTQRLTDMPRGSNSSDKISTFAVQIADLENLIADMRIDAKCEMVVARDWINTIDDGFIRTMFSLRFVECMQWSDIAEAVGGGNTADSVRMVCTRYLG